MSESRDTTASGDREHFARVDAIFDELLDLEGGERMAALDRACGDDQELRNELLALLEADSKAESFLALGAAERAAGLVASVESQRHDETIGVHLGAWRIDEAIGHGGMGAVYRASRATGGFAQRVAVKVLKRGMDSDEIIRRFERERSILARLSHPRIARLLDGGVAPDGRPWFAMELVDGQPITTACDARKLDVDARLAVFLDVCSAVRFAHQNLVVHRDLKPSNVFVAIENDVLSVRLLDFGIAKLLSDEPDGDGQRTRSEVRLLTPDYASPEQLRGEPITTATDIYALGLLLHELLTGARADAKAPSRPSTVAIQEPGSVARAAARATSPRALRRRLLGDVDRIVAMATQIDPAHRYGSVEALAEDIQRHRAGLPVHAQKASLGYLATKFLSRHRLAASAAALLVLALVGGLATTLWQARKAKREARVNQRVQHFVFDLFNDANPDVARRADVTARDLLRRATQRLESDLTEEPEVRAALYRVVVDLETHLGMFDEALPLAETSLALNRAAHPADSPEVEGALIDLGEVLRMDGQAERAETAYREALAICVDRVGARSLESAEIRGKVATALIGQRRFDEGIREHREAVALAREADPEQRTDTLAAKSYDLCSALFQAGRFDEAEALNRELLEMEREHGRFESTRVAAALQVLGVLQKNRGKLAEARRNVEASLAIYRKLQGERHPDVGQTLSVLAKIIADQGELGPAQEMLENSIDILKRTRGVGSAEVLGVRVSLATIVFDRDDAAQAMMILRQALDDVDPSLPRTNQYVIGAKSSLASLLPADESGEAIRLKQDVLNATREVFGVDSREAAFEEASNANLLVESGDLEGAKALLLHAATVYESDPAPQLPWIAYTREGLGFVALSQKDWTAAESHFRLAVAARMKGEDRQPQHLADGQIGLARALVHQERFAEALPYFDDSAKLLEEALGADHARTKSVKAEADRARAKIGAPK